MAINTDRMREMINIRYLLDMRLMSHYNGCEYDHLPCAVLMMCSEIDDLRKQVNNLSDELHKAWLDNSRPKDVTWTGSELKKDD